MMGENTVDIFLKQYSDESQVKKKKFNLGDTVRINRTGNIFEKGITCGPLNLLKVSKVLDTKHVMYRMRDTQDEEILGGFYENESEIFKKHGTYQIEKILKTRTHRGKRQLLVRWLGYNSDFDS